MTPKRTTTSNPLERTSPPSLLEISFKGISPEEVRLIKREEEKDYSERTSLEPFIRTFNLPPNEAERILQRHLGPKEDLIRSFSPIPNHTRFHTYRTKPTMKERIKTTWNYCISKIRYYFSGNSNRK